MWQHGRQKEFTSRHLGKDDKRVWESLELDGRSLRRVTEDVLQKCGMGFGSAFNIVSEIQELTNQVLTALPLRCICIPFSK